MFNQVDITSDFGLSTSEPLTQAYFKSGADPCLYVLTCLTNLLRSSDTLEQMCSGMSVLKIEQFRVRNQFRVLSLALNTNLCTNICS